ncbi:uncharacterized protein ARMOST_12666 [Armillaria ostoyae]|uniref:Uncharacterized protein n=1 Tax=Armillaria ostoyae TaxID=47428 RepID=A0A284RKK6_ARMOS|nr:uncharacterized protein ARMOST_12666 [Armillaria ostoyae]
MALHLGSVCYKVQAMLTSAIAVRMWKQVPKLLVRAEQSERHPRIYQAKATAADAGAYGSSLEQKSPHGDEARCPSGNDTSVSEGQEAVKHTLPMVTTQEWLKPFKTEWTWRAIRDAKDKLATKAVLLNWIHKA